MLDSAARYRSLLDFAQRNNHTTGSSRLSGRGRDLAQITREKIHENEHACAPTTKLQAYTADDDVIAMYTVHLRATTSTAGTNN